MKVFGASRLTTRATRAVFGILVLSFVAAAVRGDDVEDKINHLVAGMSQTEKIGQTALRGQPSSGKGALGDDVKRAVREGRIGAFLNVMDKGHVEELQRIATEESPHKIPLLYGRDVIHGFKTIFPIPLGMAATFDPETARQGAEISAVEATTNGIRWTFAPMLDIARDPRWGRIAESPGEDPYLAEKLAAAYVRGLQGSDNDKSPIVAERLAACAKHYAAYGATEGGRDYNTTEMSEGVLRDVYLRPFHAAANAGAATFMSAFNELDGAPCTANEFLLKKVLRDEWGFRGFVVSDWTSVTEMINHGFAADERDAARRAANAGLDMEMVSDTFEKHLSQLIDEGKVSQASLDDFVRNILRVKMRLGLFEHPGFDRARDNDVLSESHLAAARKAAAESMVLLKNADSRLPLAKSIGHLAVIGPLADAPHEQLGTWAFDGNEKDSQTPLAAFRKLLGDGKVAYAAGLKYSRDKSTDGFAEAIAAAKSADAIVCVVGEEAILSGEAHSRANINLPGKQEALIHELHKTGKPLVVVIMAGRPITLGDVLNDADALVMAWHPGTMGGPALADVLFGDAEPGGRLPITWPKAVGQIPIYYNHMNTGRPPVAEKFVPIDDIPVGSGQSSLGNTSHYLDIGYKPEYPFGYGLTYTTFAYSNLKVAKERIKLGDKLDVSVDVKNMGQRGGSEVVQLYVHDVVGDVVRPVRELKGFQRVSVGPGDTKHVTFTISTDDLAFHNHEMKLVTEPGEFRVGIGGNSDVELSGKFEVE
jgi:beta-glucosidase